MRLRIDLAYDGSDFHGWATQPGLRTVEGLLTVALATILRVPRVDVVCAGRTDAGVHARGQVLHCDVEAATPNNLERRLNGYLPRDIRVRRVSVADPGFDARYAALSRRYAYRIADSLDVVDPLKRSHVVSWSHPLDLVAMNAASASLVGLQEFAPFCKKREGATTIRTLIDYAWTRDSTGLAVATVRADAFCHSMVRSLVGCVIRIGEGRRPVSWAEEILLSGVRESQMLVAPAHGLTLEEVVYPEAAGLAARATETRNRRSVSADG